MNKEAVKLEAIVGQCGKHVQRLNYAYSQIAFLLPFTAENVDRLKDEEISHLDQYIFRFSKLQDTLGQKLFPAVLARLGEEVFNKSFLDIFNRLEQLDIIEDYSLWQELRIVRNEIAHEYNEDQHDLAEKLNKLVNSRLLLEKYFNDILKFLEKKAL
ncbi:Cthe_2314 family HEPN domain-containing protein [Zunongwangia sp. F260]|uniref:Cthe_2314 family HEPN domain-containing protein n=1 Tax=Autumnicola lenta TaxID=3075593 RepID=A0ABU3CNB8_9FLAO|nr:Cthe_2314 family HEPN domain-containing protein [Zunongwangia sp. F260]MDT0647425.1 Cthe_2314 family HEPN domain-containing protein [Zunongwangia sp. F260]